MDDARQSIAPASASSPTPWRTLLSWVDASASPRTAGEATRDRVDWARILPFVGMHAACLAVFWVGISPVAVGVAVALYVLRMFAITGFYHRYFSHRTFKTSRVAQFIFAVLGASAVQRGPLWWAAHHRHHHVHSDKAGDVHSPSQRRLPLVAHGLVPVAPALPHPTSAACVTCSSFPSCAGSTASTSSCRSCWRSACCSPADARGGPPVARHHGLADAGVGLLRHRRSPATTARTRSTRWRTCSAAAALRDRRRQPQQLAARAHHARRGLAQQPPPLPGLGAPGLLLVGNRHHLLPAQGNGGRRHHLGPEARPAQGARSAHGGGA